MIRGLALPFANLFTFPQQQKQWDQHYDVDGAENGERGIETYLLTKRQRIKSDVECEDWIDALALASEFVKHLDGLALTGFEKIDHGTNLAALGLVRICRICINHGGANLGSKATDCLQEYQCCS